jgi:aminocarboxymuconate-semialdehyde decarboxylase
VSAEAARVSNDELASWQAAQPNRIRWFASLPWEHPDLAVTELRRAHASGAVGVMVLANVAGRSLTEPAFTPVWDEIDRLALPVLVHPTDPPGADRLDMGSYDLTWSVGFMFDTTLAIARMIMSGFFDRYERLKIIASHGGAALSLLVGRFDKGWDISTLEDQVIRQPPSAYLRRIFYDCITYEPRSLQYLVSVVGESQVLFGSDYPHIVGDMAGMASNVDHLDASARAAVRGENAARIFRL